MNNSIAFPELSEYQTIDASVSLINELFKIDILLISVLQLKRVTTDLGNDCDRLV